MLSKELELCILTAKNDAKRRHHEIVSIEHLLLSMLKDPDILNILTDCNADLELLTTDLNHYLNHLLPTMPADVEREPCQSSAFDRLLQRVLVQAHNAEKEFASTGMVLVEMFKEIDAYAVYYLNKQSVFRDDVIRSYTQNEKLKYFERKATGKEEEPKKETVNQSSKKSALDSFTQNLTQMAQEKKLDSLIGRDAELERVIQILCRRKKNNPVIIGEPGVGKTAIVEGLAQRSAEGKLPPILSDIEVHSLDLGGVLAGTKFRGDFELRLKNVVRELSNKKNAILFIDEIHTLIGAGSTSGSSIDASNILKPMLANGELKCIGATTYAEYRNVFAKDVALSRRFQKVEVQEPTTIETIEILKGLRKKYEDHYKVRFTNSAIKSAVELSEKFIHQRFLPDKAIDVLDEAGAYSVIQGTQRKKVIGVSEVEKVVAMIARIPLQKTSMSDIKVLKSLAQNLKKKIFGQDTAIDQIVTTIKRNRAGLKEPQKPIGCFLLSGPTGVGKTEICKQLSSFLGMHFERFDMSEYMEKHAVSRLIGAPPGYVGFEQGGLLVEAATKQPYSIILLDEIEKAHPDLFNILLQVMDYGKLTDNNGQKADFRNVLLFMTSNVGSSERSTKDIGFSPSSSDKEKTAIDRAFSPEFRNRLDGVILFGNLGTQAMKLVVDKFIQELEERLKEKKIKIQIEDAAKTWLAEKGFSPEYGARPMQKVIKQEISNRLSDEILFGKLQHGGEVLITLQDQKIHLEFLPPQKNRQQTKEAEIVN